MELRLREYATSIGASYEDVLNWASSGAIPLNLVRRQSRRIFVTDPERATEELKARGLLKPKRERDAEHALEPWDEHPLEYWETKEKFFKAAEAAHRSANAELELSIKQGKFVPLAAVQLETDRMISATKAKFLAVPSQLAQRIEVSKVVRELVDSLIREALEELANELSSEDGET